MKVQCLFSSKTTDDQLLFMQQMGIEYLSMMLKPEEVNLDTVKKLQKRAAAFGMTVTDAACGPLQKSKLVDLGLPGRDEDINAFNEMTRVLSAAGIPIISVAWQPNGILRTGRAAGKYTRTGVSAFADMAEIDQRPAANDRVYAEDEIWDAYKYFCEKTVPVCEENHVRMALHPNDPPVSCLAGVPSLIYNTECYRKAFKIAGSDAMAMKMCIGCWLEGGDAFGNLMSDIEEFTKDNRIVVVHFRNVSSTMPYFEETLAEDGYANMYQIMKQLVRCGYDGPISIDHAFKGIESMGGFLGSFCVATAYMKGLLHAAEDELGIKK